MIHIAMILGGAAIGGAIGLLGRYHDNKVKKEYERGYKVGYKQRNCIYNKGDANIFMIDVRKDYNFKLGNQLWDAQQIQSIAEHCSIDISFKRDSYLKIFISQCNRHEEFLFDTFYSDEENKETFNRLVNRFIEIENGKQTTTKED